MMKKLLIPNLNTWLVSGIVVILGLLLVLSGTEESSAHHYKPTRTPTSTPTSTPTPTPAIWPCQIRGIIFDKEAYNTGETIKVTVRLADHRGTPLVGANVDAEVIRQPLSAQASLGFGLIDRAGDYDGSYSNTGAAGDYDFKFTASDPTGERFLPCMGEATVRVNLEPDSRPACKIEEATSDKMQYQIGETVTLTAKITVDGKPVNDAVVMGTVTRPDSTNPTFGPFNSTGNGSYTGQYSDADIKGTYIFGVSASAPDERFKPCSSDLPITVEVVEEPPITCQITAVNFDRDRYTINDIINLTVMVANTNDMDAEVTATVQNPDGSTDAIVLVGSGGTYTGSYANTGKAGDYLFKIMAADPTGQNFKSCMTSPPPVPVRLPDVATTVKIAPENLETTLCSIQDTTAVNIENVSNLIAVELEIAYDPRVIQVIDANRNKRGVQVRVDVFPPSSVLTNEVDTVKGRIFFKARFLDSIAIDGNIGLIAIDWRPQNVGVSAVTLERVVLIDGNGQTIDVATRNGRVEVIFVKDCKVGVVTLQGRRDHSGISVTNTAGEQTQTGADGYFAIVGGDIISFEFSGYLSAQADLREDLEVEQAEGQVVNLGTISLLAGDINGDDEVNILDMAYIAKNYLAIDSLADLNADGTVNILDLALTAGNYLQQGPLTAWQ